MTITYQALSQRHPSLDQELTADRLAMYRGGAAVRARGRRFLRQRPGEPNGVYRTRIAEMIYEPHLGSITDHFASMLFKSKPVAVATRDGRELHQFETAYYSKLKTDADHAGTNMDAVFKSLFVDAAVTGLAWLLVHDPIDGSGLEPPENKWDWENRGLAGFFVERLETGRVVDWQTDPAGNLLLAVVHRVSTPRLSAGSTRGRVVETFQVYDAADVETFQIEYDEKSPPKPDDVVPSVNLRSHPFGCVPILCMAFDPSTHLAARLETSQLAHTQALNSESWALARSAFAQPVFNVNDPASFAAPTISDGYGFVLGMEEKAGWMEPTGNAFDALNRAKKDHKDAIYKIGSAMALGVDASAASLGRSADSKAIDHEASRIALRAFADPVKELMGRLYALLSNVRGESVTWRIDGLDDLDVVAYLQALKLLRDGLDGPAHSPQARAALESRAVEALIPDATPEQKNTWRRETLTAIVNEPSPEEREAKAIASLHAAASGHGHADDVDDAA